MGAVGVPVKLGDVSDLLVSVATAVRSLVMAVPVNAVVAICVVLVPAVAVGAVGVPFKVGDVIVLLVSVAGAARSLLIAVVVNAVVAT